MTDKERAIKTFKECDHILGYGACEDCLVKDFAAVRAEQREVDAGIADKWWPKKELEPIVAGFVAGAKSGIVEAIRRGGEGGQ